MYKYTLKQYLRQRMTKSFSGRYLDWSYTNQLMKDLGVSGYAMHTAISSFSDVVYYSKKQLLQVPAGNGILLPVALYDETEV